MLGYWRTHQEYQSYLVEKMVSFFKVDPQNVIQYEAALSKLYMLDLDSLKALLLKSYSSTGAPAKNQPELIRSFVLMSELRFHSVTKWVKHLKHNKILCEMIGLSQEDIHEVGSYYDLMDRVWLADPTIQRESDKALHSLTRKPKKKLKKNTKQPPRRTGTVQKFVNLALEGKTFKSRPEMLMQQIFAKVGVEPTAKDGLYGDTNDISISGDGTCVNSGGSHYGKKVCDCVKNGNYNCDCPRKFSDTNARWGWDSYHGQYFYGHTKYILSTYNKKLKCDLPIYLRMVEAQRHDGVSAIVALVESRELYPEFTFTSFIGDGAHDNYATYELLDKWNMAAIIPLNETNKGNFKYPPHLKINEKGTPICMAGNEMIYWGSMRDRRRLKWRCPLVLGKVKSCDCKDKCSPTDYGRCIYTKTSWDLRLFTKVPRGTDGWKTKMNSRTASERVNKRILNDYGLELSKTRGKKRTFWWSLVHSLNVLLDARLKFSNVNFISLLEGALA